MKHTPLIFSRSFNTAKCALFFALFLPAALLAQLEERESAKVLTIGNSFADNATNLLPLIAKAGGKELVVCRANIGGCSLERHAKHLGQAQAGDAAGTAYTSFKNPETDEKIPVTLPEALAATDWDFVTIQQVSHQSFKPESFHPYVDEIIAAIRKDAPQAEILVHQTWAYRIDHGFFQKGDGFSQDKMYAGLSENYHTLADENTFRILPSGDAMQMARQTPMWTYSVDTEYDFENPTLDTLPNQNGSLISGWRWKKDKEGNPRMNLDAIHANYAGRFLTGCVWYLVIFNANELPDYTPPNLSEEEAASLRDIALKAVQNERAREQNRS